MGVVGIGVDSRLEAAWPEEVKRDVELPCLLVRDAAAEPLPVFFGFPRHDDIISRLREQIPALTPVHGHVLDELERVHEAGIVLRGVGGHLERGVHGQVQAELVGDGGVDMRVVAAPLFEVLLEDAGGEVHRASVEPGERQDCDMLRGCSSECLVFGAACRLVAYQVGISPAKPGRPHGFVCIDHYPVLGGLGDGIEVVAHHPLAVVVLSTRQDVSDIAGLDGVVAVFVHQAVGGFEMAFVVAHRT